MRSDVKGLVLLILLLSATVMIAPSAEAWRVPTWSPGDPVAMRGQRLYNLRGDDLGTIENVTTDDNGLPAFIILNVMDNKLVAIPYSALLPSSGRDRFVVDVNPDQLRNTPGLSTNELDNLGSPR